MSVKKIDVINAWRRATLFILLQLLICLISIEGYSQACQKIEIGTDSVKMQLLQQFVKESRKGRYFIEDKGVVMLTSYQDGKGQQVWSLYAAIDDRYKDNPPKAYASIGNDIVLVYRADSLGRVESTPAKDIRALNHCLEPIIANRLYQRPLIKERFIEVMGADGKLKHTPMLTIITGNYWNSKRIIFKQDGTYEVLGGV